MSTAETATDEGRRTFRHDWLEALSTVLLAMATVATAWSGYQATRWSGEQAIQFSKASAARIESTRASTRAGQLQLVDVTTFVQWADAYARGETVLRDFYFNRFRKEFKPAVEAWIATRPLENPDAPLSPFEMPQYRLSELARAESLTSNAEAAFALANRNNQRSDNYVLAVVLCAVSLFFAGVSTKLASIRSQTAILALGCVILLATIAWIATFPVSISV